MKSQLVIALDIASTAEADRCIRQLPADISFFKAGLELFCAEGPRVITCIREHGRHVFLDLKLYDIPRTVERAVRAVANYGVDWLTVHASGGRAMIQAAAAAAHGANHPVKILAVTALTSLSAADLTEIGIHRNPTDQVFALAKMALESGADGIVCSPMEVARLRQQFGPRVLLVTPGIRPAGPTTAGDDQKRTASPADAVRWGADALVVGRPIIETPDPYAAAMEILREMREAENK